MTLEFKGMGKVKRRLGILTEEMVNAIDEQLIDIGAAIIERAELTIPIDTAATIESGYVEPRGRLKAQAGYRTSYAPIIHVTHPTKAGWFINAVDAERTGIADRVAKNLGEVLRRVRGG